MAARKTTKVPVVSSNASMVSCWLVMEKSSSPVILCRSRNTVATSWIAGSISSTSRTWTLMVWTLNPPWAVRWDANRWYAVVMGTSTLVIQREPTTAALALQYAYHVELPSVYPDALPHGVSKSEKRFGYLGTQHSHLRCVPDVTGGNETAG